MRYWLKFCKYSFLTSMALVIAVLVGSFIQLGFKEPMLVLHVGGITLFMVVMVTGFVRWITEVM